MYRITKQFEFSASHQLTHLSPDHQCARLHGHNYVVEVVVESPCLDDRGFCQVDYGEMESFKNLIKDQYDHRHLNDVIAPLKPTAENLARHFFLVARTLIGPYVVEVGVSETAKTWARYRSPN